MKKLRIVLQCKWFYYAILVCAFLFSILEIKKPLISYYKQDDNYFTGVITSIKITDNMVSIKIRAKESLRGSYFLEENEEFLYKIGDIVEIKGSLEEPSHNTVPNLFDYNDYLKSKGESWILEIDSIMKIGESKNILDIIKRNLYQRIDLYSSKAYLKVFLLGDQTDLESDIVSSYRDNGISHLFSISGMHLSFLSGILIAIMVKVKPIAKLSYLFTCILLIFYMFLVGCSASVVRACVFFVLRYLFSLLKVKIPINYIFLLMVSLVLFIKPNFILDIGFQYSSIISYFLIISNFSK